MKIEIKQLGLATGQRVIVRFGKPGVRRVIHVRYIA